MTAQEMWNLFSEKSSISAEYEAWAFGADPDRLAQLVLNGKKRATSSAHPLYALANEPLPVPGEYSVIMDSSDRAVCVVRTTKVSVVPFSRVSKEFAALEGEGDQSLDYWQRVHTAFFAECMALAGLTFDETMNVVCEEFELVFPT